MACHIGEFGMPEIRIDRNHRGADPVERQQPDKELRPVFEQKHDPETGAIAFLLQRRRQFRDLLLHLPVAHLAGFNVIDSGSLRHDVEHRTVLIKSGGGGKGLPDGLGARLDHGSS